MTISVLEAAKYLGGRSRWSLSNLKMQKLIYIAHMFHLGIYKKELVHRFFEAWDYGPVHPDLYHYAKVFGADPVDNIFYSISNLKDEETEISILDAVEEQLGGAFWRSPYFNNPQRRWCLGKKLCTWR